MGGLVAVSHPGQLAMCCTGIYSDDWFADVEFFIRESAQGSERLGYDFVDIILKALYKHSSRLT